MEDSSLLFAKSSERAPGMSGFKHCCIFSHCYHSANQEPARINWPVQEQQETHALSLHLTSCIFANSAQPNKVLIHCQCAQ